MRRGRRRLVKIRRSLVLGCQCWGGGGDVCNDEPYLVKRGDCGQTTSWEWRGWGRACRQAHPCRACGLRIQCFLAAILRPWNLCDEALERPDSALCHPPALDRCLQSIMAISHSTSSSQLICGALAKPQQACIHHIHGYKLTALNLKTLRIKMNMYMPPNAISGNYTFCKETQTLIVSSPNCLTKT